MAMFAPINVSTSGDTVLAAAGSAAQRVRVLGYLLDAAGAVNATFKDGATPISGAMPLITGTPNAAVPGSGDNPLPVMQTSPGAALVLNLSAAVQVSGWLVYDYSG